MLDRICESVAELGTLTAVCELPGMPSRQTVGLWLSKDKEFFDRFSRAKETYWMTAGDDEVLAIADSGGNDDTAVDVQRSRLRTDVRFRLMESHAARTYARKTQAEITGKDGSALIPAADPATLDDRIRQICEANPGLLEKVLKRDG